MLRPRLALRPRLVLAAAGALVVAWIAATGVLFFAPSEDSPTKASAVVVLAGSRGERLKKGITLVERGVAPVLAISEGWDPAEPEANRLCAARRMGRLTILCFHANPFSTRGEAETVARIAARRHWHSIVVVTSDYHVTRARILFRRCFHGKVQAVGAPFKLSSIPSLAVSEWAKLVYALAIERRC